MVNEKQENDYVPMTLRVPKHVYKQLGQTALNRETTRTAIIKEALKKHLKETDKEEKLIIPDKLLDRYLEQGFDLDEEDNFITEMQLTDKRLKDLTPTQWYKVQTAIEEEYESMFTDSSDLAKILERLQDLEPSKDQTSWLENFRKRLTKDEEDIDESEEEEEEE